ncbi:MAG TPA: hypothetical protein VMB51_03640 [Solirubrobacteraceae bacterium]|nr:hypothetical protein [Solirubrobacteraceae bacterium]
MSSTTVAPDAQLHDVNARDTRADEVCAAEGYTKEGKDGRTIRLNDKMAERAAGVLIAEAVAEGTDERLERALTREKLYEKVFPHGPRCDDEDEIEREVADLLAGLVWTFVQPSHTGRVQVALGSIAGATDVLLCRRKIGNVSCVYLTRDHEMIMEDYMNPGDEKMVRAGEKHRKDAELAISRQRGLETRIRQELEATAAKTAAALGVTPALGSGRS